MLTVALVTLHLFDTPHTKLISCSVMCAVAAQGRVE